VHPPARAHNGTTARWRLNIGNQEADAREKVASFLWRVSGKIGNIASRMETKHEEPKKPSTRGATERAIRGRAARLARVEPPGEE
jgi:hypothetical protein